MVGGGGRWREVAGGGGRLRAISGPLGSSRAPTLFRGSRQDPCLMSSFLSHLPKEVWVLEHVRVQVDGGAVDKQLA